MRTNTNLLAFQFQALPKENEEMKTQSSKLVARIILMMLEATPLRLNPPRPLPEGKNSIPKKRKGSVSKKKSNPIQFVNNPNKFPLFFSKSLSKQGILVSR